MASPDAQELEKYEAGLVFKAGEEVDLGLLEESRTILYSGTVLRQKDKVMGFGGWMEMHMVLFDHYLVVTTPKDVDGTTKYEVHQHPIPLDFLTLGLFNDQPTPRNTGLLGEIRARSSGSKDPIYPFTLNATGRYNGSHTFFALSSEDRDIWEARLTEAIDACKVRRDMNPVIRVEKIGGEAFVPAQVGDITCSVSFDAPDGRKLIAVGSSSGVWIGFREEGNTLKRVVELHNVTQCAYLHEHGVLIVLADKSLFAYLIELLVPGETPIAMSVPQKLNGSKPVEWFTVGTNSDRTVVIYSKKKGLDTVFRVLEPDPKKLAEARGPAGSNKMVDREVKLFRVSRDFFMARECFSLHFLKTKVAILCNSGFEIMDLVDFKSVRIPSLDDPGFKALSKRIQSCKPLGMFRSSETEFLLCFDDFGIFVNPHGDPSPTRTPKTLVVTWEGTANSATFEYPYLFLFHSTFIEVRDVNTGYLSQVLWGIGLRCTFAEMTIVSTTEDQGSRWHAQGVMMEGEGTIGKQVLLELVPI